MHSQRKNKTIDMYMCVIDNHRLQSWHDKEKREKKNKFE